MSLATICRVGPSMRDDAMGNVCEAIEVYVESLLHRNAPNPPSIHDEVIDVAV